MDYRIDSHRRNPELLNYFDDAQETNNLKIYPKKKKYFSLLWQEAQIPKCMECLLSKQLQSLLCILFRDVNKTIKVRR